MEAIGTPRCLEENKWSGKKQKKLWKYLPKPNSISTCEKPHFEYTNANVTAELAKIGHLLRSYPIFPRV